MTTFGSGRTQVDGQGTPPFTGNAWHCLPIGSMDGRRATHRFTPWSVTVPFRALSRGTFQLAYWKEPITDLGGSRKTLSFAYPEAT